MVEAGTERDGNGKPCGISFPTEIYIPTVPVCSRPLRSRPSSSKILAANPQQRVMLIIYRYCTLHTCVYSRICCTNSVCFCLFLHSRTIILVTDYIYIHQHYSTTIINQNLEWSSNGKKACTHTSRCVLRLRLGNKLLVNLLQVVKRTNTPLITLTNGVVDRPWVFVSWVRFPPSTIINFLEFPHPCRI